MIAEATANSVASIGGPGSATDARPATAASANGSIAGRRAPSRRSGAAPARCSSEHPAQDHEAGDEQHDREHAPEQQPLEAGVGAQVRVEVVAHANSPSRPVFSVFSHVISVPRSCLRYAAAEIAHSSGP